MKPKSCCVHQVLNYSDPTWIVEKDFEEILSPLNSDTHHTDSRRKKQERNLWQQRFWEHWIRDEADYHRHCDYIHYNPVKHGLCQMPAHWQYSSFHQFAQQGVYPHDWGNDREPDGAIDFGDV